MYDIGSIKIFAQTQSIGTDMTAQCTVLRNAQCIMHSVEDTGHFTFYPDRHGASQSGGSVSWWDFFSMVITAIAGLP